MSLDYDALARALLRAGVNKGGILPLGADTKSAGEAQPQKRSVVEEDEGRVVDGVGDGVRSVESWADAVEGELAAAAELDLQSGSSSRGSVTMPDRSSASVAAAGVKFGGLADVFPEPKGQVMGSGYYTIVRSPRVKQLRERIEQLAQVKLPRRACEQLAICTYAAGTMPSEIVDGKRKLKSLEHIGDAAMALAVSTDQWAAGCSVENAQTVRSKFTNDKFLNGLMVKMRLTQYVSYAAGVDAATTSGTATAFEAIVGVLVLYRSQEAVVRFLRSVGVM